MHLVTKEPLEQLEHPVDKERQVYQAAMDCLELPELQDPPDFKDQTEALEALELLVLPVFLEMLV